MMVQAVVVFYGLAFAAFMYSPLSQGLLLVSITRALIWRRIVRGGIISIDKGQFEAAHSIGNDARPDDDQYRAAAGPYATYCRDGQREFVII
jgi:ABC-type amino acid transport system permease subunit